MATQYETINTLVCVYICVFVRLCERVKEKEKKTTGVDLKITVQKAQILRNASDPTSHF
jgi:hypothetical protein